MPDLERRSSASFISSKEGGTPASVRRSWMKRRSSNCLRVNIGASGRKAAPGGANPETNQERTLSVPYVFRNPLIWSEQVAGRLKRKFEDVAGGPGARRGRVRRADHQAAGAR